MASLSNINGLFDVHSTGAILFSTSHGTSGQILRSNGNAAPTWIPQSDIVGAYLPLAGGTLAGATATASGISFTVGGTLNVSGTGTSTINGDLVLQPTKKLYLDGGNDTYITEVSANLIGFNTGGGQRLSIGVNESTFAGNIKLSSTAGQTATPSYIWLGNDYSNGQTRDKLKIYLYNSGTEKYGFSVGSQSDVQYHSNQKHDFYVANSVKVRINTSGNVGIGTGTASPASVLHVKDNSAGPTQISLQSNDFTRAEEINFLNPSTSAISGQIKYYTNPTVEYMSFSTSNNSATVERMRIANNGWVSVVTKPNSGLNYDVAIWVGNVLGYQTTSQLSDVLAYNANKLSPYNGITFADGQEATNSGGTVIPAPGRNTSPAPQDYQRSFSTEFKLRTASGNPGITGSWAGLISMAPYRPSTSGFYATQIAFGGDGTGDGMFTRRGTTTTWGAWREFVIEDTSGNISPSGVYLGGTAATNLLNHYEQGTYAPILKATSGSVATMNLQNGYWTRIGNQVTVGGTLTWSANGSNANSYTVITMPFSNTGATNARAAGTLGAVNGIANGATLRLVIDPGQNQAYVIQQNSTSYSHTNNISASGAIYGFSITYRLT